jgi:hypothetical protein
MQSFLMINISLKLVENNKNTKLNTDANCDLQMVNLWNKDGLRS